MRRIAVCALLFVLACQRHPAAHQSLGEASVALAAAFNADAGKVRVVMLASPTSEVSLRRAKLIAASTFLNDTDPRLAVYVVWSPQPPATEDDVAAATQEIRDPRAQHFWDAGGVMLHAVQVALHLPDRVHDVYLVYGASAHWVGAAVPTPALAIHQADDQPPETLDVDAERFAARAEALLKDAPPATQPAGPTRHP